MHARYIQPPVLSYSADVSLLEMASGIHHIYWHRAVIKDHVGSDGYALLSRLYDNIALTEITQEAIDVWPALVELRETRDRLRAEEEGKKSKRVRRIKQVKRVRRIKQVKRIKQAKRRKQHKRGKLKVKLAMDCRSDDLREKNRKI